MVSIFYIITIMPKKIDHEARRRDIAEAAVQVIGEQGIDNTRLIDVARAANATTGAITHYFDDNDALLLAAFDHVAQRILHELHDAPTQHAASVDELISKAGTVLPIHEEGMRDWRVWLCFLGRAVADPTLARINKSYYVEFRDGISSAVERLQNAGKLDNTIDPGAAADSVLAAIDGIGVRATLDAEEWPAERQKSQLETMLRAILPTR